MRQIHPVHLISKLNCSMHSTRWIPVKQKHRGNDASPPEVPLTWIQCVLLHSILLRLCSLLNLKLLYSGGFSYPGSHHLYKITTFTRWSGDVMERPGDKNFNAVAHNRSWPEVLFLNLTWRSRGQILLVLLQLLLFALSNRKFGRHGKWSVTFWQWENNT